jgi:hypothetical protein
MLRLTLLALAVIGALVLALLLVLLLKPTDSKLSASSFSAAPFTGPARVGTLPSVPIVFASRNHVDTLNGESVGPPVEVVGREKIVGGKLLLLNPDSSVFDLTVNTPIYDVQRPAVSLDGKKLVFSGVKSPEDFWHLYEVKLDGSGFRQLTFNNRDFKIPDDPNNPRANARIFARYGDFSPTYLPDGRILFASTRYASQSASCGQRALNLYVMNADGTGMHRLTTERAGAIDPYVLSNGRVAFAHWIDNMNVPAVAGVGLEPLEVYRNFAPSSWGLWSMNPDGSDAGRFAFNAGKFESRGGIFQPRELPDGRIVYTFREQGNLLGSTLATGIAILTVGAGEGNTVKGIGNPKREEADHALGPAPLPNGDILFSYTPTATVTMDSQGPRTADFDYGLYLSDGNLSKAPVLVYDLIGTDELDAVAVVARTAKVIPDAPDAAKVSDDPRVNLGTTVTLRNSNIYADLALDFKEILSPKIGTVVAVDFYDDSQAFSTSADFPLLRKQMPKPIVSVPINPDGSFEAVVPADKPIFWVLRGPTGAAARYVNSPASPNDPGTTVVNFAAGHDYFRPGNVAACTGCHRGHMINPDMTIQAKTNLARIATAKASSQTDSFYHAAERAIDNRLAPQKGDNYEWASKGERGAWLQLDWAMPVTATEIVLYPRRDAANRITSGTLTFSEGSSIAVNQFPEDGSALKVRIGEKRITWARFTIDQSVGKAPGLAEMVVNGSPIVEFPRAVPAAPSGLRSEERRVGKECRRLCRSRWSPYH